MRRLAIAFTIIVALLPSCRQEFTPSAPVSERREVTLTAYDAEAPGTRTLAFENGSVWWEAEDEVKVFCNGEGSRFVSTNTEPAAIAEFRGTLNVLIGFDEGLTGENALWGLYPYREDAESDGTSVTTTLPSSQEGRDGSFSKGSYITLGHSDNLSMAFWGVCGGVRFTVNQEGIKKATFKALGGEPLAGRIKMAFADGVPSILSVSDTSDEVTLTMPGGQTFTPGVWYFIVTLPGTLSQGFSLTFQKGSRTATRTVTSPVTIKRKTFGSLKEPDKDLEFTTPGAGGFDDPINFADEAVKAKLVAAFDTNGDGELSFGEAEAVTSIKDAFGSDKSFTSFDEFRFFAGVTSVPDFMFRSWTSLKSITLPESVTTIGRYAFASCSSLEKVNIPDGVTSLGQYCFQSCSALTSVEIPFSISELPDWAFYGCSAIKSFTIPESIKKIGNNCFRACSVLESINIPESVTEIGVRAFQACKALKGLTLPLSLTAIPDYMFYGCTAITSIDIPTHITAIGASAYENCTGITVLTIPAWIKSVGAAAFRGCSKLDAIYVKAVTPPTGGSQMFHDTNNCPIHIPTGGTYSETNYWKDYVSRFVTEDGSSIYYTSSDYSRDGEVILLQKATVGRGVNFILLGDGFLDRDMGDGGKYETRMRQAMEHMFKFEPYKSLRNRFNIYTVKVVSANNRYNDPSSDRRLTYDSSGSIDFRSEVCTQYGNKVPNSTGQPLKMAALVNSSSRVGRSFCTRTWSGWACCIVYDPNDNVLVHELCGHGFGDLWDEYTEKSETFTDTSELDLYWNTLGWGANTDWRSDPAQIRWAYFLSDPLYASEELGVFEGAKLYPKGIYRPTLNSMMRSNNCPFNAPSREQIYKNTMKWSEGSDWSYDRATFVEFDAAGRAQAAGRLGSSPSIPSSVIGRDRISELPDYHIPPVIIDDDVTEVSVNLYGRPVISLKRN